MHIIVLMLSLVRKIKQFKYSVNRFDEETKQSFLELYDKVDADVDFNKQSNEAQN